MSEFIYVFIYVINKALVLCNYRPTITKIFELPEEKRHNTTQNNDVTRHSYDC